jgi:exodeoxyribonuclease V alpha subunit
LAIKLGIPLNHPRRYEQAILHCLKTARSEGHCFLPEAQLHHRAYELLTRPDYFPSREQIQQVTSGLLQQNTIVEGIASQSIYHRTTYRAELSVSLRVKSFLSQPLRSLEAFDTWLFHWEAQEYKQLSRLSEEQKNALRMAVQSPLSLITGGPGRGKTYLLKVLTEWLAHQGVKFALVAPTGKAANRMEKSTGCQASTIHRLLQWQGEKGGFKYHQGNRLSLDWLVVDEFSMVDIFLFNSLLKACPDQVQVLLVGDPDQLPSVGAGMVLKDLLNSEVLPTTRLTTIYRQQAESGIIRGADDVNQGKVPAIERFNQAENWVEVSDFAWLETTGAEATATAIVDLVRAMKTEEVELNHFVMVLAPQKKGSCGVHRLNQLLQPLFNPPDQGKPELLSGEVIYRVKDRVIQLRNRYDTTPAVMNGESGSVVAVDLHNQKVTVEFNGGAQVSYGPGDFDQLMHSFCLTCHKSQGSEFPYVIMPLVMAHYRMLTRQLLYTTMTRAQGIFIGVGQEEALEVAVKADKPARRYTGLPLQLLTDPAELGTLWERVKGQRTVARTQLVTVAKRLRDRGIEATKGQMTSIGSLALGLYVDTYGHRPSRQLEQVGSFRFKTYHYEPETVRLLDQAIDTVIGT